MFGIGPYEMLIILAVGLMLFSPKELPAVMRGIAKFWGTVRRTADEFRDAVMQDADLREPLDELKNAYDGARDDLRGAELQARRELMKARMEVRRAEAKLAEAARETEETLAQSVAVGSEPEDDEPEAAAVRDEPAAETEDAAGLLPPPPPTGSSGARPESGAA